jgi:hypothetical protein
MRRWITLLLIGLSMVGLVRAQDESTSPPVQSAREIYTALAVGESAFEPELWLVSASEKPGLTTAEWRADEIGGLGFLTIYHFDQGILPEQVNAAFGNDWFTAYFANYESWSEESNCQFNQPANLTLREFTVVSSGVESRLRFWLWPLSETRVATLFVTFPSTQTDLLDQYAERLFPDAALCSG